MAQITQTITIDARNIEPMKSLMVVLGQEYDNLPESVKRALDPLLEDDSVSEPRRGGYIPAGKTYRVGEGL